MERNLYTLSFIIHYSDWGLGMCKKSTEVNVALLILKLRCPYVEIKCCGWGNLSFSKMLARYTEKLSSDCQHPYKLMNAVIHFCNPSSWEAMTSGYLEIVGHLFKQNHWATRFRERFSQNKVDNNWGRYIASTVKQNHTPHISHVYHKYIHIHQYVQTWHTHQKT